MSANVILVVGPMTAEQALKLVAATEGILPDVEVNGSIPEPRPVVHIRPYEPTAQVRPEQIIDVVERCYGLRPGILLTRDLHRSAARARQVAMYVMRTVTDYSFPAIGREFGRDYTTVIHGVEAITRRMETDAGLRSEIDNLLAVLDGND